MKNADKNYQAIILSRKYKSQGVGLLLSGLLGGIGTFYSSIMGGVIILISEIAIGYKTALERNSSYYSYYLFGVSGIDYRPYVYLFIACRLAAMLISYTSIKGHNEEIDQKILSLEVGLAKQEDDIDDYKTIQ